MGEKHKRNITENLTPDELENTLSTVKSMLESLAPKQQHIMSEWLEVWCKYIRLENNFELPYSAIPGTISKFIYDYLYQSKKEVVDTYYKFDDIHNQYVLNYRKSNIPIEAVNTIINSVLLRRGNVVWVEFGYNIGAEFGGKHPAIIIKNCGKTLIVIPLSSQQPTSTLETVNITVPQVYNFPRRKRWANVTRITPVSTIRIDFDSIIGSVSNIILKQISNKLQENGIK